MDHNLFLYFRLVFKTSTTPWWRGFLETYRQIDLQIGLVSHRGQVHQVPMQGPLVLHRLRVLSNVLVLRNCLDQRRVFVEHLKIKQMKITQNTMELSTFYPLNGVWIRRSWRSSRHCRRRPGSVTVRGWARRRSMMARWAMMRGRAATTHRWAVWHPRRRTLWGSPRWRRRPTCSWRHRTVWILAGRWRSSRSRRTWRPRGRSERRRHFGSTFRNNTHFHLKLALVRFFDLEIHCINVGFFRCSPL